MKLPQVKQSDRYIGLYVVDFGDHCAVGFTAEEVAELLDSDAGGDVQVYRIHNAYPDGRLELTGVRREMFELEAGIFFYARDEQAAADDFARLCALAQKTLPPSRAKVHLSADPQGGFVTALIYPAEQDSAFSRWLLDIGYRTQGAVEGGTSAVQRYYDNPWRILDRRQLWAQTGIDALHGQALQNAAKRAVVR